MNPSALEEHALDFGMSEQGDLLVGEGALHAVFIIAEAIVVFVVVFFLRLFVRIMELMLGKGRGREMLRVKLAEVILGVVSTEPL